ncbi:MAG: 1-acyl-sn-glycerol-3-phosphate acyltransferase [Rhodobacterales bacterium 17-64-5]|nr:MAG: 1-acyl-sn-glycerol-3-phosphate acyltransferase [Rhodobacterales bacterium 17-64-5]
MTGWLAARLPPDAPGLGGWLRVVWRGALLVAVVYGGFAVFLACRLIEVGLRQSRRPLSRRVTQGVCRMALLLLHLRLNRLGQPFTGPGAFVANHAGWVDVFVLNSAHRVTFVAKSEVAGWPGVGALARATGTLFITRKGTEAKRQQDLLFARLTGGEQLMFFPEGTSTDSLRILPFKSTLFAALFSPALRGMAVQPVTVVYHPPPGTDPRHYGWWGDMTFAGHLLRLLATPGWGRVTVTFHPSLAVRDFADRKALAQRCEALVRSAHPGG